MLVEGEKIDISTMLRAIISCWWQIQIQRVYACGVQIQVPAKGQEYGSYCGIIECVKRIKRVGVVVVVATDKQASKRKKGEM
jgi:hypothetical protein